MPELDLNTITDLLRRSPIFGPLEEAGLEGVVHESAHSQHRKGAVLWNHGDDVDQAAFVLHGRLDLMREREEGNDIVLRSLGPGDLVLLTPLAGEARPAKLVVGQRADVLFIPGDVLRREFRKQPQVRYRILGPLGVVVGELTDRQEEQAYERFDDQLAVTLERLAGDGSHVELTQEEIGEIVGVAREKVARVLRDLQARGLIHRQRGRIDILRH